MTPLESAIVLMENEIAQMQSLVRQPFGSDIYWWAIQAKSLGLSHLRSLVAQGIDDPIQADQVRKLYRAELQPAVIAAALASAPN